MVSVSSTARGTLTAAVVVVGVVVLAVVLALCTRVGLEYDEAVYLGIAEQIRGGLCPIRPEGPGAVYLNNPPLVMVVVAIAGEIGGDALGWLRGVHVVVWALPLVIATWWVAREMFGATAALLACVALLTQVPLLREAAVVKLDVPLATVATVFIGLVHRGAKGRWLAVLTAAAALIRYQGAMLGAVGFVVLAIQQRSQGAGWRALGGRAGACLLGALVGGLCWIGLASACGGDFFAALGANLVRLGAGSDESWFQRPLLPYWSSLVFTWIGPWVAATATAALVLHRRRVLGDPRLLLLVAWIGASFAFCSVIGLKAERYFVPAMPALCVLSSILVAPDTREVLGPTHATRFASIRRLGLVGGVLVAVVSLALLLLSFPRAGLNAHYARVGARVAMLVAPEDRVMLPHVQVAYLARRHYYVSVFERDPAVVRGWLCDPEARVMLVVTDDRILTYHPNMPETDARELQRYVREHFERVALDEAHVEVWRRVWW